MSQLHEHDLEALHAAVLRENQEPYEGAARFPVWMIAGIIALVGWAGWYLGRYDARFDSAMADQHAPGPSGSAAVAAAPEAAADGAQVYASRCAACHQPTGAGTPGLAPPLAGSPWVTGDAERMLKIVIFGLQGPVEVNGQTWNGAMPAWGSSLTDAEIAAVVSHVRGAWGNAATPVDAAAVAAVKASTTRSTPWTAPEL